MADTDKKSAKPTPDPKEQKTVKKEDAQELADADLDQVSGGIDGSAAWTASGQRKR
jgi:hypothetical protein